MRQSATWIRKNSHGEEDVFKHQAYWLARDVLDYLDSYNFNEDLPSDV